MGRNLNPSYIISAFSLSLHTVHRVTFHRPLPSGVSGARGERARTVGASVGVRPRGPSVQLRGSSSLPSHHKPDSGRPRRSGPAPIRASEGLRAPVAMVVSPRPERAGQADQDGRPSGAALTAIDLSVVRGVGSSKVVPGSVGSYRPVIAGAKLREGTTTILPRGGERSRKSACLQCAFTPLAGTRRRQRRTSSMVHGRNRIPYWRDRRLTGLAGPDYDATISFGLPIEPEDSQYGESRINGDCPYGESRLTPLHH